LLVAHGGGHRQLVVRLFSCLEGDLMQAISRAHRTLERRRLRISLRLRRSDGDGGRKPLVWRAQRVNVWLWFKGYRYGLLGLAYCTSSLKCSSTSPLHAQHQSIQIGVGTLTLLRCLSAIPCHIPLDRFLVVCLPPPVTHYPTLEPPNSPKFYLSLPIRRRPTVPPSRLRTSDILQTPDCDI